MGALANEVRETITKGISDKKEQIENEQLEARLATEKLDVTPELKFRRRTPSRRIPSSRRTEHLPRDGLLGVDALKSNGAIQFRLSGICRPEHSARSLSETFYTDTTDGEEIVLPAAQTSPVQVKRCSSLNLR